MQPRHPTARGWGAAGQPRERGGGVAWRLCVFWSAAAGAHWPFATYCPSLGPSPSIGGGTHRPLTTPVPFLPLLGLSFPLYFPFLPLGRLCQGQGGPQEKNGGGGVFLNGSFAKRPLVAHMFNHCGWRLAVGGWRLAVGGGWWWLAAVGGWGLGVDGGWRLVTACS